MEGRVRPEGSPDITEVWPAAGAWWGQPSGLRPVRESHSPDGWCEDSFVISSWHKGPTWLWMNRWSLLTIGW